MRIILSLLLVISAQFLTSCTSPPALVESIGLQAPISWELPSSDRQVTQGPMPSRRAWSERLYKEIDNQYDVLMTASDIDQIIPNKAKLTRSQRITVLCELMSTVAKYEISWNEKGTAPDTNGRTAPQYLARGLFQMNGATDSDSDQKNYRTSTNYTWQELSNPLINIEVGVKILATVVKVRGKIMFSKNEKSTVLRYFYDTLVYDKPYGAKVIAEAKVNINKMVAGF